MKIFVFDIMLKGRFVCTLRYEYCALFPIDLDELTKFILSKRPTLRNHPITLHFEMETTDKEFESIKSKILKLKALAERGEKGEAINAQRLLDKLLGQYGITLDEVIEKTEERKWYKFACRKKYEQKLLHQCYFKALNKNELQYSKGSGGIYYQLTAYEFAELSNLYEWHKAQLNKEMKRMIDDFTEAYIIKHKITSDNCDDNSDDEDRPLTKEDLERISRITKLMYQVEDTSYCKMLEQK